MIDLRSTIAGASLVIWLSVGAGGCADEDPVSSHSFQVTSTADEFRVQGIVGAGEAHSFHIARPAGSRYATIELHGGGDADLYARFAVPPTTDAFDCRPYREGTDEVCLLLGDETSLFVTVLGWAPESEYELIAHWEGISTSP